MISVYLRGIFGMWGIREWFVIILLLIVVILINYVFYTRKRYNNREYCIKDYIRKDYKNIIVSSMVLYLSFVFVVTIGVRTSENTRQLKLIPLWSWIRAFEEISKYGRYEALVEILMNFFMLMPVGILFGFLKKSSLKTGVLVGVFISNFIEAVQLIFYIGFFEWDDIIHNSLGCVCGVQLGKIVKNVCRRLVWKYKGEKNNG